MKLDARTIAGLSLPPGKADQIFWDDELRGFGFRLRQRGDRVHRTWIAQYRTAGHTRRPTLGAAEKLLPAEARAAFKRARELSADLARAALALCFKECQSVRTGKAVRL